jgi:hypothetical protein
MCNDFMSEQKDRAANTNTFILIFVSAGIAVLGYFAKNIADDTSSTKTDVTTIKAQLPYMQQQIDGLQAGQTAIWHRIGSDGNTIEPGAATTTAHPAARNP